MQLADVIDLARIECDVHSTSRKKVLEQIGDVVVKTTDENLAPQDVYEGLLAREKLGSTAIGHGVAIPHCRLKNTDKTIGAFLQLHEGIDFDATDKQHVDLLFALMVPEESTEEHLQILAQLAEMFSDENFRERLRRAGNRDELYKLLMEGARRNAG